MVPASSLVLDLWDVILDHLESSRDLENSALVCSALVHPAQTRLFRTIDLGVPSRAALANRLAALFADSPHLIGHVRTLRIAICNAETLTPIALVPWSKVSTISFSYNSNNAEEWPHSSAIGTLVALRTLRTVSFYCMRWQLSSLRAVLERVSPTVCNLSVTHCVPYDPPPDPGDPPMYTQRPAITSLDLSSPWDIPLLLVDAFDFSRLTHFKFSFCLCVCTGIQQILHASKLTIQSLDFPGADDDVRSLDLGSFPSLSHLTLQNVGPPLQQAMENSGTMSIRTICYLLPWISGTESVKELETIVLAANMPMLRRVRVEVNALLDAPDDMQIFDWVGDVKAKMPHLEKRGILDVTLRM
ncbi:hypothetical protein C8R45DRAFT_357675 [Mycena sanguinolenta]|nr:hypothetical protein C8R45DRAFT_357675 [Mycena sanguinolenta]